MWKIIQASNPIWYVDATGNVIEKIKKQKLPYYYSIVCHDNINKQIIPLACFVTTSHTVSSISTNLTIIKDLLVANINASKYHAIAPIIVTDHSWALIGSIMKSFNQCTVLTYLIWCFDIFIKGEHEKAHYFWTKVYICSIHMLKIIIKHAKLVVNTPKKIKNALIFSFTLLQNSIHPDEFNSHLEDIFIIFNSQYETSSVKKSVSNLKEALALRGSGISFDFDEKIVKNLKNYIKDKVFLENESFTESILEHSPYTQYYGVMIKQFTINIQTELEAIHVQSLKYNEYFNPNLYNVINNKLYIAPLWCGHILQGNIFNPAATKLDNNTAEGWFNICKNKQLMGRVVMPSELVGSIYNRLLSKYFQFYHSITPIVVQLPQNNKKKDKYDEETWKDKRSKKDKKINGCFYKDANVFGVNNSIINPSLNRLDKTFNLSKL